MAKKAKSPAKPEIKHVKLAPEVVEKARRLAERTVGVSMSNKQAVEYVLNRVIVEAEDAGEI